MVYMYIVKHNFILGGICYYTKGQLHVSAIKFGHLQVVHDNLSIGYTNVSGGLIDVQTLPDPHEISHLPSPHPINLPDTLV
jgi:hypothetical protein